MDFFLPIFCGLVLLLIALIAGFAYRQHCRLKLRQMAHEERLVILHTKPELIMEDLEDMQSHGMTPSARPLGLFDRIRSFCLLSGLIFLFGGTGMMVGFMISQDRGLARIWPLGLIPMFIGVGFLLYVFLSLFWPTGSTAVDRSTEGA